MMAGAGGLRVTVAPSSVTGFGVGTVTTNNAAVASVTGGIAPYSYLWTLEGDGSIYAVTPSNSMTFFRRDDVSSAETYGANATVTVTDATGATGSGVCMANIIGTDV